MKEIEVEGSWFRVHESGEIERKMKSGTWKVIKNTANHNQGYNVIVIQKKQYMRSRLMYMAFFEHKTDEHKTKFIMHHKDCDRLNCALSNLSIETYGSIRQHPVEFTFNPVTNKFISIAMVNNKKIKIGEYDTHDLAYDAHVNFMNQH